MARFLESQLGMGSGPSLEELENALREATERLPDEPDETRPTFVAHGTECWSVLAVERHSESGSSAAPVVSSRGGRGTSSRQWGS
jgi:hypothetical protein